MAGGTMSEEEYIDGLLNKVQSTGKEEEDDLFSQEEDFDSGEDLLASLDSIVNEINSEKQEQNSTEQQEQMDGLDDLFIEDPDLDGEEIEEIPLEEDLEDLEELDERGRSLKKEQPKKETNSEKTEEEEVLEDIDGSRKKNIKSVYTGKKNSSEKKPFPEKVKNLFFKIEEYTPEDLEREKQEREKKEKQKGEEKKVKEEEQKKKAAEKKEEQKKKKQENEERKRKQAELKAAEKEKKKKAKAEAAAAAEPEEVIHLRPAFLLFLASVTAAITMVTLMLSNQLGYQNSISSAERYFNRQEYQNAHVELAGLKINRSDQNLSDRIQLLTRLENQYDVYQSFITLKMDAQALDALLKGVGIYEESLESAGAAGIMTEYQAIYQRILEALSNTYGISEGQASALAAITDAQEYTIQVHSYVSAD